MAALKTSTRPGFFSQFKQVLVLPVALSGYGGLGIGGAGGPVDGLQGIDRSANSMRGNVGGCHRLAGGTRSGASRIILPDFTRSGVSGKRSPAYVGHPEHAGIDPRLERFKGVSRAMVVRIVLLKTGQDTPGTVNCPDG